MHIAALDRVRCIKFRHHPGPVIQEPHQTRRGDLAQTTEPMAPALGILSPEPAIPNPLPLKPEQTFWRLFSPLSVSSAPQHEHGSNAQKACR
jgi:hypothetical protein